MNPLMPLVVMSGPNYVADYTASVTRVGNTGQLGDLFDPEAFTSPDLDELEDLWVQEAHAMRTAREGIHRIIREKTLTAELSLQEIQNLRHSIELDPELEEGSVYSNFLGDLNLAITLLESNSARCVSLKHKGWMDLGYDTHSANLLQIYSLDELFEELLEMYRNLEYQNPSLFRNLTIVLLSEMGRFKA